MLHAPMVWLCDEDGKLPSSTFNLHNRWPAAAIRMTFPAVLLIPVLRSPFDGCVWVYEGTQHHCMLFQNL